MRWWLICHLNTTYIPSYVWYKTDIIRLWCDIYSRNISYHGLIQKYIGDHTNGRVFSQLVKYQYVLKSEEISVLKLFCKWVLLNLVVKMYTVIVGYCVPRLSGWYLKLATFSVSKFHKGVFFDLLGVSQYQVITSSLTSQSFRTVEVITNFYWQKPTMKTFLIRTVNKIWLSHVIYGCYDTDLHWHTIYTSVVASQCSTKVNCSGSRPWPFFIDATISQYYNFLPPWQKKVIFLVVLVCLSVFL